MKISLPENLKRFIERRVKSQGFSSPSAYLCDLIRKDAAAVDLEDMRKMVASIKGGGARALESVREMGWQDLEAELSPKPKPRPTRRRS